MMREVYGIKAKRKVEIAVASSYPAEIDFWQATKAVFAPDLLTKPGGTIILTTECCEGIGPHPEYADYIGDNDPDRLLKDAYGGKTVDPIAVSGGVTLGRMAKRKKFMLVSSGVSKQYAQRMNMQYFADIQQAVDTAIKSHGPQAKVSVLTHAGCSYPFFE
jgi:nickel-dependent lactate racemase